MKKRIEELKKELQEIEQEYLLAISALKSSMYSKLPAISATIESMDWEVMMPENKALVYDYDKIVMLLCDIETKLARL